MKQRVKHKAKTKKSSVSWTLVVGIIVFVLGAVLVLTPFVMDLYQSMSSSSLNNETSSIVSSMKTEKLADELEKAREYNARLAEETPDLIGQEDDRMHLPYSYDELLDMNNGIMGSIDIPSIGVSLPILHYDNQESLARGAGHMQGSSLPVGGETAHTIISGHTGFPGNRMFDEVSLLKEGDYIFLNVAGQTCEYRVFAMETAPSSAVNSFVMHDGKDYLTLVTCVAYGINDQRLFVHAERVPDEEMLSASDIDRTLESYITLRTVSIAILVVAVTAVVAINIRRKNK